MPLDAAVHRFTVGSDAVTDLQLLAFDALGSAAHARMLAHTGLLDPGEAQALVAELHRIESLARQGAFPIPVELEDGHTAIEAELTRVLGDTGKRIHLGRSRNDQVILAMRLLMRERLLGLGERAAALAGAFLDFARLHENTPMPGYTHLRRAMPSSFGQWAVAFAESLLEELEALHGVYGRLDRCPLGAAAGFGVPLPLDRAYTAGLLGFSKVQRSPVDVQNSRGRHELAVLRWICSMAGSMEKWLWDISLYTTEEFGFLALPDAYTTGSSIMPQKRNPDVIELARARCRELRGLASLVEQLGTGLPSNYHRDFQGLKAPVLEAMAKAEDLLEILLPLVPALIVRARNAAAACTDELYAAQRAFELVGQGLPFRDAYRQVAQELISGAFAPDRWAATPSLELDETASELALETAWLHSTQTFLNTSAEHVWSLP